MAEIIVWQQRRELRFALALCRRNQTTNLLSRRDAQRPHARLRLRRIIGERQHGDVGRTRNWRDRGCLGGGQGSEDQTRSISDRRACRRRGAIRCAGGVLGVERRCIRGIERKLCRVQHRLTDIGACA